MGGGICTNCLRAKAECVHTRRKEPKERSKTSIQSLKTAKENVAKILSTTTPYAHSPDAAETQKLLVEVAHYARTLEEQVASLQAQSLRNTTQLPQQSPLLDGTERPKEKHIAETPTNLGWQFTRVAMQYVPPSSRPMLDLPWRRPEIWERQPWETLMQPQRPRLSFPEDDLITSLVTLFFLKVHPIVNILHEATFRTALFTERLHVRDPHFGAVVLLVCALASRHSEDPRVMVEGTTDETSCGWKWFAQVRQMMGAACDWVSVHPQTLYQLQLVILSIAFLSGTAMGSREESWLLAGQGLRYAEACALHRRDGYGYTGLHPLQAELYRRAVWVLLLFDTIVGALQGRQGRDAEMQIDELDLDLPSACDEDYWGEPGAVQPVGRPSRTVFLLGWIEVVKILWDIQNTVFANGPDGATDEDVHELDAQLNVWLQELPEHLKWNARLTDPVFLDQSAVLYISYYHTQITLHRVFIPVPGSDSGPTSDSPQPPALPLEICAAAARANAQLLRAHGERQNGFLNFPGLVTSTFDCAMVLLVNILNESRQQSIQTQDEFDAATSDLQTCLAIMKTYERRWRFAGRRYDSIRAGLNLVKFAVLSNSSGLHAGSADSEARPQTASTSSGSGSSTDYEGFAAQYFSPSMVNLPELLPDNLDAAATYGAEFDLEAIFGFEAAAIGAGSSVERLWSASASAAAAAAAQNAMPVPTMTEIDLHMFTHAGWGDWTRS
ncbi:hypothetical protein HMN09_00139600 [Mycena chlorophos]|uniref:Xylanolytic transcriptional activator regulatory domain-containing protein n=1 Tax=Mycena chlorophos TaxID=658473 RepID=A0A8H6TNP5_MYCCL|nr:hypothetical protein HMN09_00139600 [Mycena chlorophos]